MKEKMDIREEIYKITEPCKVDFIAELFGLTKRRIWQLTNDEKVLKTTTIRKGTRKENRYDLAPTIQAYIEYLSERTKQKNVSATDKENESAKLDGDARYKQAKAEMAEMELKEMRGELHRAEDVERIMTNHVFAVRSMLLSLPNRLAVDTANAKTKAEAAEIIKRGVYDILNQLSGLAYDKTDYQKLVRERQGWEENDIEEAEFGTKNSE